MGKVIIAGVDFNLSTDLISSTTGIPSHGEKWFKGMYLDLQDYKQFSNLMLERNQITSSLSDTSVTNIFL